MKKYLIIPLLLLGSTLFAQSPIGAGGKQLNFGLGLQGDDLPMYIGMDFGVHKDITVGPVVGINLDFDYLSIAGRGDYHFNSLLSIPQTWDFYAGLQLGFGIGFNNRGNNFDLGAQVGGRWYWSSRWGLNLEFGGGGYGMGGRFGLSMKM